MAQGTLAEDNCGWLGSGDGPDPQHSATGFSVQGLERVDSAPLTNRARFAEIQRWWQAACPNLSQQDVSRSKEDNLVCRIEGNSKERVVVGAHFDKVAKGRGVADNWSGVVILDALMKNFSIDRPFYTIDFVAFAAEESGLHGSKRYLSKSQHPIKAMINLDTLGLGPLTISKKSDTCLKQETMRIAQSIGVEVHDRYLRHIGGDWQRFAKQDIPAINLHSVTKRTIKRIHNRKDRAGNVDLTRLREAYGISYLLLQRLAY